MKLGVSMWSYYATWKKGGMDIPKFIETAKLIGAEGVELLDFFWTNREAELPAVNEALARTGLPVGVYSVANNFVSANAVDRAASLQRIRDGVDNAVHFKAKVVRVFAGNEVDGISFDQAFGWIVEGLREAAEYAQMRGVTLALENHGKLAGRSHQVLRIVDAVGSSALKANPDTGNFLLVHQAPFEALIEIAPVAAMVHFKDFREVADDYTGQAYISLDGLRYAGTAVGEGDVALERCVIELKAANFDGWLNIEYEGTEDPLTALPRSMSNARVLLAEI